MCKNNLFNSSRRCNKKNNEIKPKIIYKHKRKHSKLQIMKWLCNLKKTNVDKLQFKNQVVVKVKRKLDRIRVRSELNTYVRKIKLQTKPLKRRNKTNRSFAWKIKIWNLIKYFNYCKKKNERPTLDRCVNIQFAVRFGWS